MKAKEGDMNELLRAIATTSCNLLGFQECGAVDMHCHLDFAHNALPIAQEGEKKGVGFFSGTVTPERYERAVDLLGNCNAVRVGLGLHPWWVSEKTFIEQNGDESQFQHLMRLAKQTIYINEVGLDFSSKHCATKDAQVRVFKTLMTSLEPESIVSLHSVKASDVVLDILNEIPVKSRATYIFHWFSGSSNELLRALGEGCYFSVGERFLSSKRGKEYRKAIPENRFLLETDLPAQEHSNATFKELYASLCAAQDLILKGARTPT